MLKVGLTGGIGSGKSTVAKIFEVLNVPVYYADAAARRLMHEDESLVGQIRALFGENAYLDKKLNSEFIGTQVFSNQEKLEALNKIVHPATLADAEAWIKLQQTPYIIKEAAILFESGADKQLDLVIGVYSPPELRIERIMKRDGSSREIILQKMSRQMNEEEKMERCDFVLTNDEQSSLLSQVLELHQKLLAHPAI